MKRNKRGQKKQLAGAAVVAIVLSVGAVQIAMEDRDTRAAFMDIAKVSICSYIAVHLNNDAR